MVCPPYRAALRLWTIAGERWAEIDAAYYQVDILTFTIDRLLNCVYAWCIERVDPEKREEWIVALDNPLPGESVREHVSEAAAEMEGSMFMAAMQQHKTLAKKG